jgi:hypothetical protein
MWGLQPSNIYHINWHSFDPSVLYYFQHCFIGEVGSPSSYRMAHELSMFYILRIQMQKYKQPVYHINCKTRSVLQYRELYVTCPALFSRKTLLQSRPQGIIYILAERPLLRSAGYYLSVRTESNILSPINKLDTCLHFQVSRTLATPHLTFTLLISMAVQLLGNRVTGTEE